MNDMGIALDRLLTIYEVRSFIIIIIIVIIIIITLTAYIFGMKHDIDTRSTVNYKGYSTSFHYVMNFIPQTA